MATQKSQHYVPKCMLRQFSKYTDARAIDLFNISGGRVVLGASLRHQCARNYLYGSDLTVEKILADLEGHYSRAVQRLVAGGAIDAEDIELFRLFVHLQRARTESAATRLAAVRSSFFDLIEKQMPNFAEADLSTKAIMQESLATAVSTLSSVKDLAFAILVNKTKVGFFTSDNPVSTPNRFLNQRNKLGNYGLGSAGVVLAMPVSPEAAIMFYDRGVYQIDKGVNHRVEMKSRVDVERLNFITFCFADKNVYFGARNSETDFVALAKEARDYRDQYRSTFSLMRLLEAKDGESIYKRVEREEFEKPGEGMIVHSQLYPVFAVYPSILRLRGEPKFVGTGSGAGFLRPATDKEW